MLIQGGKSETCSYAPGWTNCFSPKMRRYHLAHRHTVWSQLAECPCAGTLPLWEWFQLPAAHLHAQLFNCVWLFATPWTAATPRASLSMGLSRPFPLSGDLLDPGMEPASPALADGLFTIWAPGKPSHQQSGLLSSAGSVTFPQADLFLLQIQYPYSIFVQYCNLEVIHLCKVVA